MRRSNTFLALIAVLGIGFAATWIDADRYRGSREQEYRLTRDLVYQLGLSDPALFTEARYTRHPSLADLNSPFQDHPGAIEHFPSGSLLPPPRRWLP
jgi:hypothetical protein